MDNLLFVAYLINTSYNDNRVLHVHGLLKGLGPLWTNFPPW